MRQNYLNVLYGMKNAHPVILCIILIMEEQCVAVRYWQKCTHIAS